jgi:hypothetical protein
MRLEVQAQVAGERGLLATILLGDRNRRQAGQQIGIDLGTTRMDAQRADWMGHAPTIQTKCAVLKLGKRLNFNACRMPR